jgi:hypothetical protein
MLELNERIITYNLNIFFPKDNSISILVVMSTNLKQLYTGIASSIFFKKLSFSTQLSTNLIIYSGLVLESRNKIIKKAIKIYV